MAIGLLLIAGGNAGCFDEAAPMFDGLRRLDRESRATRAPLGTGRDASARVARAVKSLIEQTPLQTQDLAEPLDVPARQRQHAERESRFLFELGAGEDADDR